MMGKWRKGQGTLEYILVLLAVLLAVIAAANSKIGGDTGAIGNLFTDIKTKIDTAGDKIAQ